MSKLKPSITILVSYILVVLGLANIDWFQESILDFSPVFFAFVALIVFSELSITSNLIRSGFKISSYMIILFWIFLYIITWLVVHDQSRSIQVEIIQLLLVAISAGLAYDVGQQIGQVDKVLDGLSSSAFPNRARELSSSEDLIAGEITRSRRYHHPLSLLVLHLEVSAEKITHKKYELLEIDMLERFAVAKVSQILSDLARVTDIIFRDKDSQFVVVCPETNFSSLAILAERIVIAVYEGLGAKVTWGGAVFPDEALTFDELLQIARTRMLQSYEEVA